LLSGHLEVVFVEITAHEKIIWGALDHDGVLGGSDLLLGNTLLRN
jgi:hypothetical protein